MIVGDEGEGIHRFRIHVNVHPKSYRDIVCRALHREAFIAEREEEGEEEESAVQDKGSREGAEVEVRLGQFALPPPTPKATGEDL